MRLPEANQGHLNGMYVEYWQCVCMCVRAGVSCTCVLYVCVRTLQVQGVFAIWYLITSLVFGMYLRRSS